MSKYGKSKYATHKYGRYEIDISADQPLSQITKYRLRTINSLKRESRPIVNISTTFTANGPVRVRLRTDSGKWVHQQSETLQGEKVRIRIAGVSKDGTQSSYAESVIGTIKNTW